MRPINSSMHTSSCNLKTDAQEAVCFLERMCASFTDPHTQQTVLHRSQLERLETAHQLFISFDKGASECSLGRALHGEEACTTLQVMHAFESAQQRSTGELQAPYLVKSGDTRKNLSFQKLQRSSTPRADVAHLVSKTCLLNSCHAVTTTNDSNGSLPCKHTKSDICMETFLVVQFKISSLLVQFFLFFVLYQYM